MHNTPRIKAKKLENTCVLPPVYPTLLGVVITGTLASRKASIVSSFLGGEGWGHSPRAFTATSLPVGSRSFSNVEWSTRQRYKPHGQLLMCLVLLWRLGKKNKTNLWRHCFSPSCAFWILNNNVKTAENSFYWIALACAMGTLLHTVRQIPFTAAMRSRRDWQ